MPNSGEPLERFKVYLEQNLQNVPIKARVEELRANRSSTAGKGREGIFAKEFLCPWIYKFFQEVQEEFALSDDEIRSGLGAEGFETCKGFGFTPASIRKHL